MSYLTLNGIEIEVAQSQKRGHLIDRLGVESRALDGTLVRTEISSKREWAFITTPQVLATALAIEGLIEGRGYNWTFDADLYADGKGLINSAGTTSGAATASGKFSNRLDIGSTEQLTYPVGAADPPGWTFMVYRLDGTWKHYAMNSNGTEWENGGTVAGGTIVWVSVSGANLLVGDGANAYSLDDLVFLPYVVPAAWITGTFQSRTAAFSDLPALTMSGDIVGGESITVQGRVTGVEFTEFENSGLADAKIIGFSLKEV